MAPNTESTFDIAACRARLRARQAAQYRDRERQRQALLQALRVQHMTFFPDFVASNEPISSGR